jgi:hypothetical protein
VLDEPARSSNSGAIEGYASNCVFVRCSSNYGGAPRVGVVMRTFAATRSAGAGLKVVVISSYLYNQRATDSASAQTGEAAKLRSYDAV